MPFKDPQRKREYQRVWSKTEIQRAKAAVRSRKYKSELGPLRRRIAQRKTALKRYGLTFEKFDGLVAEQKNKCAICRGPFNGHGPCIDHDGKFSHVRGLLCLNCNAGIGMLKHSIRILESAMKYLSREILFNGIE